MSPSRYFADLTQPEIAAQLKKNPLVILPAGSVEQQDPIFRPAPTRSPPTSSRTPSPSGWMACAAGDAVRRHADARLSKARSLAGHLHAPADRDLRRNRQHGAKQLMISTGTRAISRRWRSRPKRCIATTA
jgi:hypothetical protein